MSGEGVEMPLEQFIRSKWFIATARLMAIVGGAAVTMGGSFVVWAVLDTRAQAELASQAVLEVRQVQTQRALVSDANFDGIDQRFVGVERRVETLDNKQDAANATLSEIKGIVSEIARRDVAARMRPDF